MRELAVADGRAEHADAARREPHLKIIVQCNDVSVSERSGGRAVRPALAELQPLVALRKQHAVATQASSSLRRRPESPECQP